VAETRPSMLGWQALAQVMKDRGMRIELFWNSGGQWFTARLVTRDGRLADDDALGAHGSTPVDALQNLALAAVPGAPRRPRLGSL
jgi:hypothetical protein